MQENNFRKMSRQEKAERAYQRKIQGRVPRHKKGGLVKAKSLALRFRKQHSLSYGTRTYPVPRLGTR